MKILKEIARYPVGALFIFSGLIKINDPKGTAIKLEEYFDVFSYDFAPFFEYLIPAALFLSVFLSVLEIVLGLAVIIGYEMKISAWILLGLIVFFTFLTFYSAYFNKVTDCGCFGDAIKLTPWESFYKDLILLILIVIIFINRDNYQAFYPAKWQHLTIGITAVIFTYLGIFAIRHLPFVDFRAYAIGNHLPTLMNPSEELRYEYVLEKDGETFSFEQYPTEEGYEFKEMKLLNPEAQPKITDLSVWTDEGDYTDQLFQGEKLLLVIYDVENASKDHMDAITSLTSQTQNNIQSWILTSSGYEQVEALRHEYQLAIPFFYADATVLKTMVRSNPGILLLSDGTVVGKWHHNDVPDISTLNRLIN
ncbi:MAG: DoxX family protein [Cyclobacteriaceae bacterium]